MISSFSPISYSFGKSPSENLLTALKSTQLHSGSYVNVFGNADNDIGFWDKYAVVTPDGLMDGIELSQFIKDIYDGSTPTCLIAKLYREIKRVIYDVTNALGLGSIGCAFITALDDVVNVFKGISIICTATIEAAEENNLYLSILEGYSSNYTRTNEELGRMYKSYLIIGKDMLTLINSDDNSKEVYEYLFKTFIIKLVDIVNNEEKNDKEKLYTFMYTYFDMLEYIKHKYLLNITDKHYNTWKDEYYGM
jgi:hypothetical protein